MFFLIIEIHSKRLEEVILRVVHAVHGRRLLETLWELMEIGEV
jgi:hypothetical protein